VFESFFAEFVSGQVIPFAVGGSSGSVGMLCEAVKFRSSIVATLGHCDLLACSMQISQERLPCWRIAAVYGPR